MAARFAEEGCRVRGFFTEEVRVNGSRIGARSHLEFQCAPSSACPAIFAHADRMSAAADRGRRQWDERQCMTLRLCVAGFDVVTVPDGQRGEKIYIVSLFNPA